RRHARRGRPRDVLTRPKRPTQTNHHPDSRRKHTARQDGGRLRQLVQTASQGAGKRKRHPDDRAPPRPQTRPRRRRQTVRSREGLIMTTTLITGTNKGLGFETARQLAAAGHHVWIAARDVTRGQHAADALDARFVQLDVTDDASVAAAAATLAKLD